MKAVICQNSELTVADLPEPKPGKGQVLVEVLRCGICGSDLHIRRKRPAAPPVFSYVTRAIFAHFGRDFRWQEDMVRYIGRSTLLHVSKAS